MISFINRIPEKYCLVIAIVAIIISLTSISLWVQTKALKELQDYEKDYDKFVEILKERNVTSYTIYNDQYIVTNKRMLDLKANLGNYRVALYLNILESLIETLIYFMDNKLDDQPTSVRIFLGLSAILMIAEGLILGIGFSSITPYEDKLKSYLKTLIKYDDYNICWLYNERPYTKENMYEDGFGLCQNINKYKSGTGFIFVPESLNESPLIAAIIIETLSTISKCVSEIMTKYKQRTNSLEEEENQN